MSVPTARGVRPALGAAGISFIILLAAFGIYYFVYAERQTAYFSHRDLRILNTVARQLEDADKTRFTPDVLFAQSVLRVFDSVMLADAGGTVRNRSGEERIATLDKLQTTGTWQKPKDIDLSRAVSLPAGEDARGNFTAYADGSVRFLPVTLAPQKIRAMATRAGGEPRPDF